MAVFRDELFSDGCDKRGAIRAEQREGDTEWCSARGWLIASPELNLSADGGKDSG